MTDEELKYYKALQGVFKEKMGRIKSADMLFNTISNRIEYANLFTADDYSDSFLRIPCPIDTENPERGLWGMIDWRKFYGMINSNGLMTVAYRPKDEYDYKYNTNHITEFPTLALLKALAAQEGIEV